MDSTGQQRQQRVADLPCGPGDGDGEWCSHGGFCDEGEGADAQERQKGEVGACKIARLANSCWPDTPRSQSNGSPVRSGWIGFLARACAARASKSGVSSGGSCRPDSTARHGGVSPAQSAPLPVTRVHATRAAVARLTGSRFCFRWFCGWLCCWLCGWLFLFTLRATH